MCANRWKKLFPPFLFFFHFFLTKPIIFERKSSLVSFVGDFFFFVGNKSNLISRSQYPSGIFPPCRSTTQVLSLRPFSSRTAPRCSCCRALFTDVCRSMERAGRRAACTMNSRPAFARSSTASTLPRHPFSSLCRTASLVGQSRSGSCLIQCL